jgi:hypothetical protein
MHEQVDVVAHTVCGTGSVPGRCLAALATLSIGVACLAGASIVAGLFGPVAAAVIAAERLLCAARSHSAKAATGWTGIAFGWVAAASCMVHAPWAGVLPLQWLVVTIVVLSALFRVRTVVGASALQRSATYSLIAAGVVSQLATLFVGTAGPLSRVAAVAAIELVLIGSVRLLEARSPRDTVARAPAAPSNLRALNDGSAVGEFA